MNKYTIEELNQLLYYMKNRLDITWDDDDTDNKIMSSIMAGINDLDDRNGSDNNFIKEGIAKDLLYYRTLYDRSNALSDFYKNYASELQGFVIDAQIERLKENET